LHICSGYATNGRLSGNIRVDLQKQRQRERHQQIEKDAKQGDQEQPSFAEPIRIVSILALSSSTNLF